MTLVLDFAAVFSAVAHCSGNSRIFCCGICFVIFCLSGIRGTVYTGLAGSFGLSVWRIFSTTFIIERRKVPLSPRILEVTFFPGGSVLIQVHIPKFQRTVVTAVGVIALEKHKVSRGRVQKADFITYSSVAPVVRAGLVTHEISLPH